MTRALFIDLFYKDQFFQWPAMPVVVLYSLHLPLALERLCGSLWEDFYQEKVLQRAGQQQTRPTS